MAVIALLAILLLFSASRVAAQNVPAPGGTGTSFPFDTATAFGGFGTGTPFFDTSTFNPFGTDTGFGPLPTDPFSNTSINTASNAGKVIGIVVGITLGFYLILFGIVLWVFITRQRNRKAWYGPTAEFYRNGGRMGEFHASQPLLGGAAKSFVAPSSSPAPSSTQYPALHYHPSTSPSTLYNSEMNYGYGNPPDQYPQPPTGQYDPNASSGQSYLQYNNPQTVLPDTGYIAPVIQV